MMAALLRAGSLAHPGRAFSAAATALSMSFLRRWECSRLADLLPGSGNLELVYYSMLAGLEVQPGGKRIGSTVHPVRDVICLYTADPWGNVVKILDASFDRMATLASAGKR